MTPVSPVFTNPTPEVVFAKNQPQYLQLPAAVVGPLVTTKWRLSWPERIRLLCNGYIWLQLLTFGEPLQPVKLSTIEPTPEGDD